MSDTRDKMESVCHNCGNWFVSAKIEALPACTYCGSKKVTSFPVEQHVIRSVGDNVAPNVDWDHPCGWQSNSIYDGKPSHFVLRQEFRELPIPWCYETWDDRLPIGLEALAKLYENQGYINWPAKSSAD